MLILGGCFIDGGEGGGFGGYERLMHDCWQGRRPSWLWERFGLSYLSGHVSGGLSAPPLSFGSNFCCCFFRGVAIYEILWQYFGMLFLPLRVTSEG